MEKPLTQHPEQKLGHQGPGEATVLPFNSLVPLLVLFARGLGAPLTFSPFQSVGGQIWRKLEQLSGVSDDRIPSPDFCISFSGCKALTAFPKQPVPLLNFSLDCLKLYLSCAHGSAGSEFLPLGRTLHHYWKVNTSLESLLSIMGEIKESVLTDFLLHLHGAPSPYLGAPHILNWPPVLILSLTQSPAPLASVLAWSSSVWAPTKAAAFACPTLGAPPSFQPMSCDTTPNSPSSESSGLLTLPFSASPFPSTTSLFTQPRFPLLQSPQLPSPSPAIRIAWPASCSSPCCVLCLSHWPWALLPPGQPLSVYPVVVISSLSLT